MINVYICESAAEIQVYVNAQGIPRASIQAILCDSSGLYSLLWWS
jgi:hypothetical protein